MEKGKEDMLVSIILGYVRILFISIFLFFIFGVVAECLGRQKIREEKPVLAGLVGVRVRDLANHAVTL